MSHLERHVGQEVWILGARFPEVKAVVAEVPSGVVWGSTVSLTTAAWTFNGTPLPYVPSSGAQPEVRRDGYNRPHYVSRGQFLADLAADSASDLAAATIHVEDTHGPVLLYGGDDDQLWASCVLAQIAFDRLTRSGHTANGMDRMLCLAGTGHAVGTPGWSNMDVGEMYLPSLGGYLVMGGNPADTGRAQRTVDTALRGFLERAFAAP